MGNIKPNVATESGMPPDSDINPTTECVIHTKASPGDRKNPETEVPPAASAPETNTATNASAPVANIKMVPDPAPAPVDYAQQGSAIATAMPETSTDAPQSIAKPKGSGLDKFKSKRASAIANVETLVTALPIHKLADAKDFVRLHPDEDNYWSDELCFVSVPIKGQKKDLLHLIEENLAMDYLPSARIMRCRLALATKPYDTFFLCQVPSRNLDNGFNSTSLVACEQAKRLWTQATSRKDEGVEAYKVDKARSEEAFPEPKWPTQTLDELITSTFGPDRMIEDENHPALRRLIGEKPKS